MRALSLREPLGSSSRALFGLIFLLMSGLPLVCRGQSNSAVGLARLDSIKGIGQIRLHTSLENLSSKVGTLRRLGVVQRTVRYAPFRDVLLIDGIHIDKTRFNFYHNRLHSFDLTVRGAGNAEVMLLILEEHFGPGQPTSGAAWFRWQTPTVVLTYEQNVLTHDAVVRFESIPLQRAVEQGFIQEIEGVD